MVAGGNAWLQGACIEYDQIRSMSGRYASYWNAFLSDHIFKEMLTNDEIKQTS